MNPAVFALKKRTIIYVLLILLFVGGVISYQEIGRLEDPTFTIKTAVVVTRYPGASPAEVEKEVTEVVEEAIQALGQVKKIYSTSREGVSVVYVDIKETYTTDELPQIWDELRRKVGDVQGKLPPGAGPSWVNDDFGDVFGVFFALVGDGYSYSQLRDYARDVKKELLLCKGVAKIELWGTQQEVVYVEFNRARMTEMGLSPAQIQQALASRNLVQSSGNVNVGESYLRVTPTGDFVSEQFIADIYIGGKDGLVRLGDVASVSRGFAEPPANIMRFNGRPAVGIGISTVDGGNVVRMGEEVRRRISELEAMKPLGMEMHSIYYQSEIVTESVNTFLVNLLEAVVIVIGLLLLFMGWRTGLLIGVVLVLNILVTFVGMYLLNIDLQKVSLGALILALGMLVDNAIVVADGFLIAVARGIDKKKAACDVVRDTQWPLLGATGVSVLAFTAIGFAPGQVSEFARSLFQVMAISLSMSWVLAVSVTPLLCVRFLHAPDSSGDRDPYDKPMYRIYRGAVHGFLKYRAAVVAVSLILLVLSVLGFALVPTNLFPASTQRYYYVNIWRPEGTRIENTLRSLKEIEEYVSGLDGVKNVSAFAGEGTLRFILTYNREDPNSSYAQLLVEVEDYRMVDDLIYETEKFMRHNIPDVQAHCTKFITGPSREFTVEARFRGPDVDQLKKIAEKAQAIMRANPNARDVQVNWRTPVQAVRPVFSEDPARRVGISRQDLAQALQFNFNGIAMGLFREGDVLLPIVARPVEEERASVQNMEDVQVWSIPAGSYIPMLQVASGAEIVWEDPMIKRQNRQKAVTVQANPVVGLAETLRREVKDEIETIMLPSGYSLEWAGEYLDSKEAVDPLKISFPICLIAMFVLVLGLFNSVRRALIVFLTVPFSIIGVTICFLLTGQAFGFMAILGFLGLSGMVIKNAIVLIDQIELDIADGKHPYQAILDSAVSRLRPVTMAAGTTILGMLPLIFDPFFSALSATIMGGLFGGTFLTLLLVPVLYSLFFKIPADDRYLRLDGAEPCVPSE